MDLVYTDHRIANFHQHSSVSVRSVDPYEKVRRQSSVQTLQTRNGVSGR